MQIAILRVSPPLPARTTRTRAACPHSWSPTRYSQSRIVFSVTILVLTRPAVPGGLGICSAFIPAGYVVRRFGVRYSLHGSPAVVVVDTGLACTSMGGLPRGPGLAGQLGQRPATWRPPRLPADHRVVGDLVLPGLDRANRLGASPISKRRFLQRGPDRSAIDGPSMPGGAGRSRRLPGRFRLHGRARFLVACPPWPAAHTQARGVDPSSSRSVTPTTAARLCANHNPFGTPPRSRPTRRAVRASSRR